MTRSQHWIWGQLSHRYMTTTGVIMPCVEYLFHPRYAFMSLRSDQKVLSLLTENVFCIYFEPKSLNIVMLCIHLFAMRWYINRHIPQNMYNEIPSVKNIIGWIVFAWWRHQLETFSASLALCERNPPVAGGFSSNRPVTRSFDIFFGVRLDRRLRKQSRCRWFEMPWCSLWRHCNDLFKFDNITSAGTLLFWLC